jgi:hypothetical protein
MRRLPLTLSLGLSMLVLTASAQAPSPPPQAGGTTGTSNWSHSFWVALDKLGVVFREIGSLGGDATSGQIWVVSLATGAQQRIAAPAPMGWPVFGRDNQSVFALHDGGVVRLNGHAEEFLPLGSGRQWRKLIGVGPGDDVLGFVTGGPPARPAVLTAAGELHMLSAPKSAQERSQVSILLQENRAYEDGTDLLVQRSVRGGRGFDIYIVTGHADARTLTDCGDDYCGQPSLSPDHRYVVYVRAPAP